MADLVLEVGAEGGSVRLLSRRSGKGWAFKVETNSDAKLHGEAPPPERQWHRTWDAARADLDAYPWTILYPLFVAPAWRVKVGAALIERLRRDDQIHWMVWQGLLAAADDHQKKV